MEILHANIIVFIKRHYEVCNVNKFNVISHHTSSITCIHHQSYKVKLDYMYEVCNVQLHVIFIKVYSKQQVKLKLFLGYVQLQVIFIKVYCSSKRLLNKVKLNSRS